MPPPAEPLNPDTQAAPAATDHTANAPDAVQVRQETPDQPEVAVLIAELDAYQRSLYPPECCYLLDLAALLQPSVVFAVARGADGRALGCGAVVVDGPQGEIKRVYVPPAQRGQGVASRLMQWLEAEARQRGCRQLVLETGPFQPEALALYRRLGFVDCGPFGDYRLDPYSVFMQKALVA